MATHIGNLQITTALIAADAIDGTKIADNAIDSEHYTDASIDNAHLADDAVGIAELSATGTANNTVFLRGDNTWASAGGGATATHDFTKQAHSYTPADYTSSGTSTTRYLHVRPLKLSNGNEDTNNEGVFIRIKKNGTHNTEVQIA